MGKLNNRHKSFIDEYLLNGRNARQAYLKVYPDCNSEEGADASASKLLSNPKVLEYLKEEEEYLRSKSRMSKEDKLKIAEEIIEDREKERTIDRLKALEIHNRMLGHNDPDKIEHSGGTTFNVKIDEE